MTCHYFIKMSVSEFTAFSRLNAGKYLMVLHLIIRYQPKNFFIILKRTQPIYCFEQTLI